MGQNFSHRQTMAILWLLFLISRAHGAEESIVTLEPDAGEIPLNQHLTILSDPTRQWTVDQAAAALENRGQPWDRPGFPTFGLVSSDYWARVEVNSRLESQQEWLAKLQYPNMDRVDLFYQDEAGSWVRKSAGDTLPFTRRDIDHRSIIFTFSVPPGQTQALYFRFRTDGAMQFPLSLLSLDEQRNQATNEFFWLGIYYGIMLVMVLYNFFIWLYTRDKSYLTYILFVSAETFYVLVAQGLAFQYLWPDSPGWAQVSLLFFVGLTAMFGMLFCRAFLNVPAHSRRAASVLPGMAVCAGLFSFVVLIVPYRFAAALAVPLVLIAAITISVIAVSITRKGYRPAVFFITAWGFLLLGILIEILQRSGANIPPFLAHHGIQIGSAIEVVLLSLGLGDRINALVKDYSSMQADLLRANQLKIEALQKADNIKDEFIANVSHELRTPLTGIIGLTEIVLENKRGELGDHDKEYLSMIRISARRLSNLVNDVIDFSAIKNDRLELHQRKVDLKSICALVTRTCRPLIGNKSVELVEHFPPVPVWAYGDEDRLQQILFNLVSNAIKFTSRGSVTVSLEVVDIDARITVRDTGIGISPEQQSRIFNRFYQVDSADSKGESGTGLGLSISQKLVELHGTEIILRSQPGEGSVFYFDLPLLSAPRAARQAHFDNRDTSPFNLEKRQHTNPIRGVIGTDIEPRKPNPKSIAPRRSRRGKVLAVDDEYLNLRIVKEHLSATYDLVTASSGAEALRIIETEKPDLLILDLMMPIMTGTELCRIIRQEHGIDELPIIILTAKNRVEDLVTGLNTGANDYISKPFGKEELLVRVSKQFELLTVREIKEENQLLNWQIDQYRQSEMKLRNRESRLAKMLDVTGDALISTDERGQVLLINRTAEELLQLEHGKFHDKAITELAHSLRERSPTLSGLLSFPFAESAISESGNFHYFSCSLSCRSEAVTATLESEPGADQVALRVCILPLNMDQEFYVILIQPQQMIEAAAGSEHSDSAGSLPQLISEINKNVERTQVLGEYLSRMTPEDLQKHRHLFSDLENVDAVIRNLSSSLNQNGDQEQQYRQALVKLMQDCHYYWQKVTGESVIDLAEKSRIWSVSVDDGRLRTRSMNRYLTLDKLPRNPRWRQVARTAYFVLSKVSCDEEAKQALEKSVARLQDIVEMKALS